MTIKTLTIYFLIGFFINSIIGAIVWAILDDENQSLFHWYERAIEDFGFLGIFVQISILQFWVIGLYFYIKNYKK